MLLSPKSTTWTERCNEAAAGNGPASVPGYGNASHSTSKEARMGRHDINADAKRVFDTITAGGAVILPGDIGYGAGASSPEALQRLFVAKQRAPHERHAMVGNYELHREVHELGSREQEIVDAITIDADLALPENVIRPGRTPAPGLAVVGLVALVGALAQPTFHRERPTATPAALTNRRSGQVKQPRHTTPRPPWRHPPRIQTCRVTCTDEVFGKHSVERVVTKDLLGQRPHRRHRHRLRPRQAPPPARCHRPPRPRPQYQHAA